MTTAPTNNKKRSKADAIISGMGSFLSIASIYYFSSMVLGNDAFFIVASMGAATVLLFTVPHAPFSQPWALFGGNIISAFIGVSCAQLIPDTHLAAPAAVSLSVAAMHYMNCTHPPAGATALIAVLGGSSIHDLGFSYVITPVLVNLMIIFFIAFIFNFYLKGRRYPLSISKIT